MKSFISGILILSLTIPALSIDSTVFISISASNNEVILQWLRSSPDEQINVYRRTGTNSYKKVNVSPVKPLKSRPEIVAVLGQDIDQYMEAFKIKYPEQIVEHLKSQEDIFTWIGIHDPRIAVILGNAYVDQSVRPDIEYEYKIETERARRRKTIANDISIRTINTKIPPVPYLRAIAMDNQIGIAWSTKGMGNLSYIISRSENENGVYQRINQRLIIPLRSDDSIRMQSPRFLDKEVAPGKKYWYKIAGVDQHKVFGDWSEPMSAVAFDSTPPPPPKIVNIVPDSSGVKISWHIEDLNDIEYFRIYRYRNLSSEGKLLDTIKPEIWETFDKQPIYNHFYWYCVASVDRFGNERLSEPKVFHNRK